MKALSMDLRERILAAVLEGWGWFIDRTPETQEEFELHDSSLIAASDEASQRIDLLTVIAHELGHALGLDDLINELDLMSHELHAGIRRLPSAQNVDRLFGNRSH